jgi:alpha-beta hydrolase superfamily lysophospholipase
MKTKELRIKMRDGYELQMYKWEPENGEVSGIVQLVHGSCEHSGRYIDFAKFLTDNGYIVYSCDLRGHGLSVKAQEDLGYFGKNNGWRDTVEDLYEITKLIRHENAGLKIVMLGHSMGSFLARHYVIVHGSEVDGVIAIGTAQNSKFLLKLGKFLAEMDIKKSGGKRRNNILNKLSYDSFSNQFKPIRTKQDWLTRDEKIVDHYIEDELCGFVFTSCAFRDMFEGLLFITDKQNIKQTPKDLPMFLLAGKNDPVGANGRMVVKAYDEYKAAGMKNIHIKLYEGMRHEILNELGKEEVYIDILYWMNNL